MSTGKTNLTSTQFAAKKLLGKAHTSNLKSDVNEIIPSNVSLPSEGVFPEASSPPPPVSFAEAIPNSPGTDFFTMYSASAGGPATVERVYFDIVSISDTTYDANDTGGGGDEASGNGPHGYYLKLPSNYQTTSSNPNKGTGVFTNGKRIYDSRGGLQLVPPLISNASPNRYVMKIYKGDPTNEANEITSGDSIDWQVDYYAGTIFIQDYDASKIPLTASAYLYVGKYLDEKITDLSTEGSAVTYGRTAVTSTITASTSAKILGVSASAALDIRLPSASGFSAGQYFTIKDEAGNANTNNITVKTSGDDRIDGETFFIIESPYGAVNIYSDGSSKFFIY